MIRTITLTLGFFILACQVLSAQTVVQVTITGGSASSDCAGSFTAPGPFYGAAVEGQPFNYYPDVGVCYTALPHLASTQSYTCPADVPLTVEVCLRATENLAFLPPPLSCDVVETCSVEICEDFIIPPFGQTQDYTMNINVPGSSSGELNFTVETSGFLFPDNDFICNAVDLGDIVFGDTLGDQTQGIYANLCATAIGEPNPQDLGAYFTNQAGVWFHFNSGPSPSGMLIVEALSDPMNVGEPINLELEVFTTDDSTCTGNLIEFPDFFLINNTFDHELRMNCVSPNTDYWIWVDGGNNAGDFQGVFGIQVWDPGVQDGGDLRCDFEDLGEVPVGGSVSTAMPVANFCATDVQDPFLPTFVSQHSVWFGFVAPPSGHVIIEGISDTIKEEIGIQLALYRSFDNTCTGFYSLVASQFTAADLDEVMEVTCLYPGRPYFILVDGSGSEPRGIFTMTVSDAGDITPIHMQDTVLCFSESLQVGNNFYDETGIYHDTLQLFAGCDSIVISDVTVLEPLDGTINQTQPAIGLGGLSGVATAMITGGAGNYDYLWCNGETTQTATMLEGGTNCCVEIRDDNNCFLELCFDVEFTTAIIPTVQVDTLLCFGDSDASLTFSAVNGVPPYDYIWQNTNGTASGMGMLVTEGEMATLNDLPAGDYEFTINDAFFDTTFTVSVVQPDELTVMENEVLNASCFGFCDGQLRVMVAGGTAPYTYNWSAGASGDDTVTDLCAGAYNLVVVDDNGCEASIDMTVDEPIEFIATAIQVQEVSCFQGNDGVAIVNTNGNPVSWAWSNGGDTELIEDLTAGFYDVNVVNGDGCEDQSSIEIIEPIGPLTLAVEELSGVSCFGDTDGELIAQVSGPFSSLSFDWNNGQSNQTATLLGAGNYAVTATNERGCTAEGNYELTQPTALLGATFIMDITCPGGPHSGMISVEDVSGGRPGYLYAVDGQNFGAVAMFDGLEAGNYDVTIQDIAGCELVIPSAVLPPPEVLTDIYPNIGTTVNETDVEVHLGDELVLTANTNSNDPVFTWSHTDTLTLPQATVQPLVTTVYQVTVLDTISGCTAEDIIRVFIDKSRRVFIPNAFTPNGDGNNDVFFPFGGKDVSQIKSFRIFSRTGQLVFEQADIPANNPSLGWDGTFLGEELNSAVFVYAAEIEFFDGKTEVFKGDVLLVR